jgi:hypothetical protein
VILFVLDLELTARGATSEVDNATGDYATGGDGAPSMSVVGRVVVGL